MRKTLGLCTLVFSFLFAGAVPARAQNVLPGAFGKWKSQGVTAAATTDPNDAAAFHEYGLTNSEQATYQRGGDTLNVTLLKFQDPTGGYGGYSYLRTPEMERSELAEHASFTKDRGLILVGNLVIEVSGKDVARDFVSLADLMKAVEPEAQTGPFPALWQFLPTKGIEDGTNHYVLGPVGLAKFITLGQGDWVGFSDGAEAETAKYKIKGDEMSMVIVDYPTPQFAQKRLEELQASLKVNEADPAQNSAALYGKRSQTLVAIVAGAKSKEEAATLLDQIGMTSEVTWNEPTFQFKEPDIGTMIVGTIVGTGIICMFAVVAGIAFGGVRIVTKIAFPEKVFDRPSQVQILQLGLSSKPINAEDFYGIELGRKGGRRGGKL